MPERTTFVGDDTAYEFVNCNDSFCSETLITYKAPKPQLDLLVKKSPSCRQTIVFNCQSSPIMVSFYSYVHMKPLRSMFLKGNEVTLTGQNPPLKCY